MQDLMAVNENMILLLVHVGLLLVALRMCHNLLVLGTESLDWLSFMYVVGFCCWRCFAKFLVHRFP